MPRETTAFFFFEASSSSSLLLLLLSPTYSGGGLAFRAAAAAAAEGERRALFLLAVDGVVNVDVEGSLPPFLCSSSSFEAVLLLLVVGADLLRGAERGGMAAGASRRGRKGGKEVRLARC